MKNLFIALLSLSVVGTIACSQKHGVVGHWKLVSAQQKQMDSLFDALRLNIKNLEDTLSKTTDAPTRDTFNIQLEENQQLLKYAEEHLQNIYKTSYLRYRKDGTYEGILLGQTESGTFTFDEAKKVIKTKPAGVETESEMQVERVTSDTLIIKIPEENIRFIFVADKD